MAPTPDECMLSIVGNTARRGFPHAHIREALVKSGCIRQGSKSDILSIGKKADCVCHYGYWYYRIYFVAMLAEALLLTAPDYELPVDELWKHLDQMGHDPKARDRRNLILESSNATVLGRNVKFIGDQTIITFLKERKFIMNIDVKPNEPEEIGEEIKVDQDKEAMYQLAEEEANRVLLALPDPKTGMNKDELWAHLAAHVVKEEPLMTLDPKQFDSANIRARSSLLNRSGIRDYSADKTRFVHRIVAMAIVLENMAQEKPEGVTEKELEAELSRIKLPLQSKTRSKVTLDDVLKYATNIFRRNKHLVHTMYREQTETVPFQVLPARPDVEVIPTYLGGGVVTFEGGADLEVGGTTVTVNSVKNVERLIYLRRLPPQAKGNLNAYPFADQAEAGQTLMRLKLNEEGQYISLEGKDILARIGRVIEIILIVNNSR